MMRKLLILAVLLGSVLPAGPSSVASAPPAIGHVFTIVVENEEFAATFGAGQVTNPYLARELPMRGAFVPLYFGTGHSSLDNYIAMTSGQGPNAKTQDDCNDPSTLGNGTVTFDAEGQAIGTSGCTYPPQVDSIATQLERAGKTWKGYMQDMDARPGVRRTTCQGPSTQNTIEDPVPAGHPKTPDDYKAKHNPFVYYHAVFDDLASCDAHDVPLDVLDNDLRSEATTPNYAFITPNQCDDGHDMPTCSDGTTGGLERVDAFLKIWVEKIVASPAYQHDGLLVILVDEGLSGLSCCGEHKAPNLDASRENGQPWPAPLGDGGGQTGAVLLSRFIKPQTVSLTAYNHYSYLRSMEDIFGLAHLGYAAGDAVVGLGDDIYTNR